MDLRTDYPFWLLDKGILSSYPSLEKDISTEVAIIGAGISGALIAWQLCNAGVRCVMVDRRHVGMGSTAATTGLLQYEIDTPLAELIGKVGYKNACDSYLLCNSAIDELAKLCRKFRHAEFARRPSFQYASFKKDIQQLKKEYTLRKHWLAHTKKTCARDGNKIIKEYLGKTQRRTFFCTACQKLYGKKKK